MLLENLILCLTAAMFLISKTCSNHPLFLLVYPIFWTIPFPLPFHLSCFPFPSHPAPRPWSSCQITPQAPVESEKNMIPQKPKKKSAILKNKPKTKKMKRSIRSQNSISDLWTLTEIKTLGWSFSASVQCPLNLHEWVEPLRFGRQTGTVRDPRTVCALLSGICPLDESLVFEQPWRCASILRYGVLGPSWCMDWGRCYTLVAVFRDRCFQWSIQFSWVPK